MLTVAVGDLHGCLDLLEDILGQIGKAVGAAERRLVFLGDYIDRGPDSAGVVARLRALQARGPSASSAFSATTRTCC